MKLLHCKDCRDMIRPLGQLNLPRFCLCGRHAMWMTDLKLHIAGAYDREGSRDRAGIIRIANQLFEVEGDLTAEGVAAILAEIPRRDFRGCQSLILKLEIPPLEDVFWWNGLPSDRAVRPLYETPEGVFDPFPDESD